MGAAVARPSGRGPWYLPAMSKTTDQDGVESPVQRELDAAAEAVRGGRPDQAVAALKGALAGLLEDAPGRDAVYDQLLAACAASVEGATAAGDPHAGATWAAIALETEAPERVDPDARRRRAKLFSRMGQHYFRLSRFPLALELHRRAVSLDRDPIEQIHLSNALTCTQRSARLSDFADDLDPETLGQKLMIACVPKSGSSFVNNVLQRLTGYIEVPCYAPSGQFEQELYLPALVGAAETPVVIQQHCRATDANVQLMQAFGIRPLVLVRDVADAIWSLAEFYRSGASYQTVFHPDFPALEPQAQVDLLITHRAPWYFEFVASWQRAERERRLPVHWLSYESLMADKVGSVQALTAYWSLGVDTRQVEAAVATADGDKARNRFNVGKSGRGRENLNETQRERLYAMAAAFPSADFSVIGVPSD